MVAQLVIVPPQYGGEDFVTLSSPATKKKIIEKHILSYGELLYPNAPGSKVKIDKAFATKLINNFNAKVCPIVQVPRADKDNNHTEDPKFNTGRVVGLTQRNNKIYAQISPANDEEAENFGTRYLGASAMFHLDYVDTRTLKPAGPTLLHVAVTNRPYVTDLDDFEHVIAASADGTEEAVYLTASIPNMENAMTLDEMLASLKADHNIDVSDLQQKAAASGDAVALSNKIQEELASTGLLKLSNGSEATADELIGAVAEAGNKLVELSATVTGLIEAGQKKDAAVEVDNLVKSGHILSKNRDDMLELRLSNAELFKRIVPEAPVIKLSHEGGFERGEDTSLAESAQAEITRLLSNPALAGTKIVQ
jgi:hypothetical protein